MVKQSFKYDRSYIINPTTLKVAYIIERPKIPITLEYQGKFFPTSVPTLCLLDSGSDTNLFPEDWANGLGIRNLDSYPEHPIKGIGDISITGHDVYDIKLYVGDIKSAINFSTWVCFSPKQTVPLLGTDGFFNHFKSVNFIDNIIVELKF